MADYENFSEISENFDTIKTLLNSIRAQGILNTSDVDKLLTGINSKLEKINTEEDIDLIKIFLSELKQNLDERHGILISKFAAIESLFSNLLKNSSEMPKSSDIKELFDIVATNLSVFSREVVSQKESLTDITLRLDAMRSDDTQKREIIKNIALLKPDLERLNNGFDSIVINLNDNFKTIAKTITSLDRSEHLDKFGSILSNIEMSSNTVLSALQVLDKKTEQVEQALTNLASKEDIEKNSQKLFELSAQGHELTAAVSELASRYVKFDNLADKIDASVNIIATLKSTLAESDDYHTQQLVEKLNSLQVDVEKALTSEKFDNIIYSLQEVLKEIFKASEESVKNISISLEEIRTLSDLLRGLNISTNFQDLFACFGKTEQDLKQYITDSEQRILNLNDANITRVLNDITTNADSLGNKLNQTQNSLAVLCEKNFSSVFENISNLKSVLSQIDENSISANNAIFSSITDRLTIFEEELRKSLESQEKSVSFSSAQVIEQVENIKNLSNILDYKLDSSVVEIGNVKREFNSLQVAVENVLALDFVTALKDLRVDLYASKQEVVNTIENTNLELSEKFTNDLYGKYELLISKLESVEEEIKKTQANSLQDIKSMLEKISESIVDVLSYVSEKQTSSIDNLDEKFISISETVKEYSLNYVESVRDIVDIAKTQIEENLKTIEKSFDGNIDNVTKAISENSEDIKKEIKFSYSKLLEIEDAYNELKEILNINEHTLSNKFDSVTTAAETIKSDFDNKLANIKIALFDRISELKQEISNENTCKLTEIKSTVENSNTQSTQNVLNILNSIKEQFNLISKENLDTRADALSKIIDNFIDLKNIIDSCNEKSTQNLSSKVNIILEEFSSIKEVLNKVDENVDGDMTRQLSIIESNFESLVSQITILFEKSDKNLSDKINQEFTSVSEMMQEVVNEKLDSYRSTIEDSFLRFEEKAQNQSEYLKERIANLNTALKSVWEEQSESNIKQISEISQTLKSILEENSESMTTDYSDLKTKISEFVERLLVANNDTTININNKIEALSQTLETNFIEKLLDSNNEVTININSKLEEFSQTLKSNIANQSLSLSEKQEDLLKDINATKENIELKLESSFGDMGSSLEQKFNSINAIITETSTSQVTAFEALFDNLLQSIQEEKEQVKLFKEFIINEFKKELSLTSKNIEKETDVIINEIIEQFDILKVSQADDIVNITSRIEEIVNSQIYNNVEDLKSYLDIKTDNSILSNKLDNLKLELVESVSNIINDLSKLLDTGVFTSSMSDFKLANEVLINSAVDNINDKIESFVSDNMSSIKDFETKLNLFDSKFTETIVDKFEEIKLASIEQANSFEKVKYSIKKIFEDFDIAKNSFNSDINNLKESIEFAIEATNNEIKELQKSFEGLRSQISSKSFDEAFQASINKQIGSLETLITEQLGYIEDISELCATSLPDVTELNTLVKHSILEAIKEFSFKLENQDIEGIVEKELKQTKSDIITQILNVFNQVSFVAEQEEILDFIQEKHDELITILSHIVTTSDEISQVKDSVSQLNDKINAIISSDGNIDYIYSLQDLESDIANLRLVLNEMNENSKSTEFTNLVNSTEEIYKLVESVKSELPTRNDFDMLNEDIESISSRTNKLLLASDESYKTLQDNLQEFKLVINDLDERTRNFAQESGMDKLDAKLNAINNMMLNGAKSNQVFNQVFEYLAEWVDNASVQINTISDKVDTLDEIGQLKTMLTDMKAQDDIESAELVDALGNVFNKQTKRITSLEKKLDKIIVETTINKTPDLTPMEDTLNKFLVAMDEKFSLQQDKINMLESKLESLMNILENKENAQLSKKVGGMDKQIAKLNKSIEKIASYVVEK